MMKKAKAPTRIALTLLFTLIVFSIIVITMIIVGGISYVLIRMGLIINWGNPNRIVPIVILALVSILVGTLVATVLSRIPLRPMNHLSHGINQLANGDYTARIYLGKVPVMKELANSFNLLAEELNNTEMLRSDFVNSFSHEFKTPIVSINGFAKLLQKEDLSKEQQQEYLQIILEESTRLADMSTNVLTLTKVENQSILTEVTLYNVSEQIRNSILLLEKKWAQKNLKVEVDFEEHMLEANEELMKQVWINLIDNSIKFSPDASTITFSISEEDENIIITMENHGPEIKEEEIKRIFSKYWQGDASHSLKGTGIGLSIVQKIIELHKGDIKVTSTEEKTSFIIQLPKEV